MQATQRIRTRYVRISLTIPLEDLRALDREVQARGDTSRSRLIREAVRLMLKEAAR